MPALKVWDEINQKWVSVASKGADGPPGPPGEMFDVPRGRIWAFSQTVANSGVSVDVILDGESYLHGGMRRGSKGIIVPVDGTYSVSACVSWQNNMNPISATTNLFLSIWRAATSAEEHSVSQFFSNSHTTSGVELMDRMMLNV